MEVGSGQWQQAGEIFQDSFKVISLPAGRQGSKFNGEMSFRTDPDSPESYREVPPAKLSFYSKLGCYLGAASNSF